MTAQQGRALLLRIADGLGGFTAVAGIRTTGISFNARTVDVTDSGSTGRWRELLAGAGVRTASFSGAGVFRDAASDALMRQVFFGGQIETFEAVLPDFGTVTGAFQITALAWRGEHDGEVTFDITLESAGPITFTAL